MRFGCFLICVLFSTSVVASDCPATMDASVEGKLLPVLSARARAADKNDWWDKDYESALTALLQAKDPISKQAKVALMDYYVGEHYGEELVCAVALDGTQMVELLELYSRCDIKPKHPIGPRDHGLPLRGYALEILKDGSAEKSCTYE